MSAQCYWNLEELMINFNLRNSLLWNGWFLWKINNVEVQNYLWISPLPKSEPSEEFKLRSGLQSILYEIHTEMGLNWDRKNTKAGCSRCIYNSATQEAEAGGQMEPTSSRPAILQDSSLKKYPKAGRITLPSRITWNWSWAHMVRAPHSFKLSLTSIYTRWHTCTSPPDTDTTNKYNN